MSGILELLVLLLPMLLGGRLLSTIIARVTPIFLNYLKESGDRKKLRNYHRNYMQSPDLFASLKPELANFFKQEGWNTCKCHNCKFVKKNAETQASKDPARLKNMPSAPSVDNNAKQEQAQAS